MSHLTQMAGLALHNFVSAASGAAVAVALIRGLVRRRTHTLGNFWVDLTRTSTRVLLPLAIVFTLVLVSQGAVQNFHEAQHGHDRDRSGADDPGGPIASQEAIKEIGENGGGPFNANSSHPFENPNPITNMLEIWMLLAIPFAFPWTFGKMAGDQKQGWVVLARCSCSGSRLTLIVDGVRGQRQSEAHRRGRQSDGDRRRKRAATWKARRSRFGPAASGLFAASTTGTSTGRDQLPARQLHADRRRSAAREHDVGEVSPGGTGSGLYGMLLFALLAVFIAGLMVGRTPEYLGKKIQAAEMKLVGALHPHRAGGRSWRSRRSRWSCSRRSTRCPTRARTA